MTRRTRTALIAMVGLAAAAMFLMATVGASAHDGKRGDEGGRGHALTASLAPSQTTDPTIHGVAAGGLPWVLDRGSVRLDARGRIRVEVRGLVIPVAHGTLPAGTALPVTTVSASLYCAPDASAAAATTKSVPLSASGDARIDDTIALPTTCLAPAVLVHPNGSLAAYIAASGWRS